jgi:1-acyl-sn-glycerol-3-phosphate acyltransferase
MWALTVVGITALLVWFWVARAQLPWRETVCLGLCRLYFALWHRGRCNRPVPFPASGSVLVVSNHTCSADPMFLLGSSNRIVSFVMAWEHFHMHYLANRLLSWMHCVPVVRGGYDIRGARTALRRLSEDRILTIFPEGNLSGVAKNRLRPGKVGVAWLALRGGAPVLPVYIAGGPRTQKLLQSWVFPSRAPVRVYFGRPVDLSAYKDRPLNRKTMEEVAAYLMDRVAALRPLSRTKTHPFACSEEKKS